MSILEVSAVNQIYGTGTAQFQALHDVNLSIGAGESVAIVGKSGSGKSTLMHIMALLGTPTSGKVSVDGQPTSALSETNLEQLRNKNFGFVFQQFFLNSNATLLDNIALPLVIAGVDVRPRMERARAMLKLVELDDKADAKAKTLSGGQKQRACIARALVNDPSVIFADEPTGNLDSQTGEKITKLLFSLNQTRNITLIIVTHDRELAERCDRQVRIADGKIASKGGK